MIEIKLFRLAHGEGLPVPRYASEDAVGLDVSAAAELTLRPGERHAVATGFAIEIPRGYEVQVRLVTADGAEDWEEATKEAVASYLVSRIAQALRNSGTRDRPAAE